MSAPVGRLAPSPTGRLHLGHARSFLLAWWHLRSRGGRVVLRIEDLDATRLRPGMVETTLRDLEWLGLDWDAGPFLQSAEPEPAREALARLVAEGRAYPCVCSRREITAALSAPHGGGELPYPGTCRGRYGSVQEAEAETGRTAGLRLLVPPGPVTVEDAFRGPLTHDVQAEVGDFLLARRDGAFAYQLAVVVDDARQGVTEVLRGDDLAPSAVRQWHVQEARGLPHPTWIHVPLVVDEDGERLAKRRGDLGLSELREAGVDPRAVVAWAARTSGQEAPDRAFAGEVAGSFDLARLPHEPVRLGEADVSALRAARDPSPGR